jgi:hypothetical protein
MMMGNGPGMIVCKVQGSGMFHGKDDHMSGRHFFTKEERAEVLERYKEWLEKEAKGVEEAIDRMNKE